jgi:hypothetical protein
MKLSLSSEVQFCTGFVNGWFDGCKGILVMLAQVDKGIQSSEWVLEL